jgi:glycosyltransferase involved in cell wall biosynthesis
MMCEAHILCWNEAEILPYALRHYKTFCSRILVHDDQSTDGTREIIKAAGVELVDRHTGGVVDEREYCRVKNEAWKGTTADWVIVVDADELIYFPKGASTTIAEYEAQGVNVVKPYGFEMFTDIFPTTEGQIYDEVKTGAEDFHWYSKPAMFSPKQVKEISYGLGAHQCSGKLVSGASFKNPTTYTIPETYLLHFKHIGGVERVAKRYDEVYARQLPICHAMKWGHQCPGIEAATKKRAGILPNLRQIIS